MKKYKNSFTETYNVRYLIILEAFHNIEGEIGIIFEAVIRVTHCQLASVL